MDVVDLDKVLDDFEFNEQNSDLPTNASTQNQCQTKELNFSNNNEFELPPVTAFEVLTNSISGDNCTNDIKASPRNNVLAYPIKTNINVENLIEYISAGANQISLTQVENSENASESVNDQNEPNAENGLSDSEDHNADNMLENNSANHDEQKDLLSNDKITHETKPCGNIETIPITISPDSDTEEDLSDHDFSESVQTSLSYTVDNQGLKVVGFNSTMDDISDTELESYLQQIEIEHNNTEMYDNIPETSSIKNTNINEYEAGGFPDSTVSDYGLYVDRDGVINYDSISQASTVEIIDAQAPIDLEVNNSKTAAKTIDLNTNGYDAVDNTVITHPTSLSFPPLVVDFQISSAGQTPINSDKNFKEYIETSTSSESELSKIEDVALDKREQTLQSVMPISENNIETTNKTQEENKSIGDQDLSPDSVPIHLLGKMAPYWIPDHVSNTCMQCNVKFTVIKRRHHCRACGQVLCSKCCCMRAKLIYLGNAESRVCLICFEQLANSSDELNNSAGAVGGHVKSIDRPNPNNPMEYCSVIPPHQQVSNSTLSPISVMVPIGVLKREGSQKSRVEKTVMFSDGIRPGSELTKLDHSWDSTETTSMQSNLESLHKGSAKSSTEKSTVSGSENTKVEPS